jgi:hypothetical protein
LELAIRRFYFQWKESKLTHSWEDPGNDIDRRMKDSPELFLVGSIDDKIVATCMGRCDQTAVG